MPKRIYDPNDPNAVADPLGPQQPGSPTSMAPTQARSALLDQLGPSSSDLPLGDPGQPAPRPGPGPATLGDPSQPQPQPGPVMPLGNPSQPAPLPTGMNYSQGDPPPGAPPMYESPAPPPPAVPSATPPAQNSAGSGMNMHDLIQGYYFNYLGRQASPDEIAGWTSGRFGASDPAGIEAQIKTSGEAQAYAKAHGTFSNTAPSPHYDPNAAPPPAGSSAAGGSVGPHGVLPGGLTEADLVEGGRGKYYGPGVHGPGEPAMIGLPNGYYIQNSDGTWGALNPRGPEGSGGAPANSGGAAASGGYQPVGPSPFNQQLRDFMMSQLGTLSQPIGADSGELAPAISAYDVQSQRDQQTERDQLAEHAYAGGNLDSGGFDTQIRQGIEGAAGKRANFTGSMVFQANTQRKQQLQQMLQTATSAGLTDQAQQIQQAIAQIDAQLRGDQLGFNYADLIARTNRDALLGGLNG